MNEDPRDRPGSSPSNTTLLVRRADVDGVELVRGLLEPPRPEVEELVRLTLAGRVIVLGDMSLPRSAAPVAAVVFAPSADERATRLVTLGVAVPLRRRGLARRLFDGAGVLLRSEGIERVEATTSSDTTRAFLSALGFVSLPAPGATALVYWL